MKRPGVMVSALRSLPALVLVDGAVVLVQVGAEVAAAVAARDEVQRVRGPRLHRRQERSLARHRDRGGRQSGPGVGIPWRIGLQIFLPQVAVEGWTEAINNGRVG